MHPIILQAIYYGIVIILTLITLSMVQRGFFWKYFKVKTSMGKYVLVKITSTLRDYFIVGYVQEGDLKFTYKKDKKKINASLTIPKGIKPEYRCLGINWIDVDESNMGIIIPANPQQKAVVSTNDVESTDNLLQRRIEEPRVNNSLEKVIVILLAISLAIGLVGAFLAWKGTQNDTIILNAVNSIKTASQVVVGTL